MICESKMGTWIKMRYLQAEAILFVPSSIDLVQLWKSRSFMFDKEISGVQAQIKRMQNYFVNPVLSNLICCIYFWICAVAQTQFQLDLDS